MTSLRFVGVLPLWLGILLAAVGAVAAFIYYRRESFDLPGHLRWLLPSLRSLAILLTLLILAGPVLHHRREIGELGNVRIVVDASGSMNTNDTQMDSGRQLLVCQDQGWLPKGQFDQSVYDLANRISTARKATLQGLDREELSAEDLSLAISALLTEVNQITLGLDSMAATKTEDAEGEHQKIAEAYRNKVAAKLKPMAGQTFNDEQQILQGKANLIAIARSLSPIEEYCRTQFQRYSDSWTMAAGPAAEAAVTTFKKTPRFQRLERRILNAETGLLALLKTTHNVELLVSHASQSTSLWNSKSGDAIPESLGEASASLTTDLSGGLIKDNQITAGESQPENNRTAVVLFSDGQHLTGPSPVQVAQIARTQGSQVYGVGYGSLEEPQDLVLLAAEYPDTIHKSDRVRGELVIKDRMPQQNAFVVQISGVEGVIWQDEFKSLDVPERRIPFEFAVEKLVSAANDRFDSNVDRNSVDLELSAQIVPVEGETNEANNSQAMRIAAITQRQKLLLIDGRSRWETRYIRNLFERDNGWEISTIIAGAGTEYEKLPRGELSGKFPTSRDALYEFDLIVFGDVQPQLFTETEAGWLRDFVGRRGGGLVFIDGLREHQHQLNDDNLGPLVPVSWTQNPPVAANNLKLTDSGRALAAFSLEGAAADNEAFWQKLPPPHRVFDVTALPGSEILAESVSGDTATPAIVTRNFGAGRVVYFAFDETWRWRYAVADQYHQRFWNQVARWVMPRPFAVSDQYLSLDSGAPRYAPGESAKLRAKLRDPSGNLVSDSTVDALLWRNGKIVSTINLTAEQNMPGSYSSDTGSLEPGDYEVTVRASGFSEAAFQAKTGFVVSQRANQELQQVALNEDLLTAMAQAGGGEYLREEDAGKLVDLLAPLSSGRVIESDTLIWQSYPWFFAIVTLLAIEWLLRKRSGLL